MKRTIRKWTIIFGIGLVVLLVPLPMDSPLVCYLRLALLALWSGFFLMIGSALLKEVRILKVLRAARETEGAYTTIRYGEIDVYFHWSLDGGGTIFAHEYIRLVAEKFGKREHIFEFCCGPGFIGFSLLAHGLCERLTLADVNPKAIEAVRETIRRNGLEDRVSVVSSDSLDGIPKEEKWDLVVGNPPWLLGKPDERNLLLIDPGSQVHEKFFRDVGKFLKPNGSVMLIEGGKYTRPDDFRAMIEKNRLQMLPSIHSAPINGIFRNLGDYPWLRWSFVLFLRLYLFEHKVYFLRATPEDGTA